MGISQFNTTTVGTVKITNITGNGTYRNNASAQALIALYNANERRRNRSK